MGAGNAADHLVLSNRADNLKVLKDYIRQWGKERGLSRRRRECLLQAAAGIFQHLVGEVYGPGQPGTISIRLEDRGSRLRLVFEDDAPPLRHPGFPPIHEGTPPEGGSFRLAQVCPLADSLIYYRTEENKNRLVMVLPP